MPNLWFGEKIKQQPEVHVKTDVKPGIIKSGFDQLYFAMKNMESALENAGYGVDIETLQEELSEVREAFDDFETYYYRFMGKLSHNPELGNANTA